MLRQAVTLISCGAKSFRESLTCDLPVPVAPTTAISGRLGLCGTDDIHFSTVFHIHSGADGYSLTNNKFQILQREKIKLSMRDLALRRYPPASEPPKPTPSGPNLSWQGCDSTDHHRKTLPSLSWVKVGPNCRIAKHFIFLDDLQKIYEMWSVL